MDPLENDLGGAGLPDQYGGYGWAEASTGATKRYEHDKGGYISIDKLGRFAGANEGMWRVQVVPAFGGGVQTRRFDTKRQAIDWAEAFTKRHPAGP